MDAGRATIDINIPQVLVIRVEDSNGRAVSKSRVNVTSHETESASSELFTDEKGDVTLLGVVGSYTASVELKSDRPLTEREMVDFQISRTDSGERLILLRVP